MSDRNPTPPTPEEHADPTLSDVNDPFAGLTPIDVIDGELVPRHR